MNRAIRVGAFGAAMFMVVSAVPVAKPASAASLRSVTSWIEISSTRPASGCTIDVSIEIRESGSPVDSTEIELALSDEEEVISLDYSVTNADGIAYLAVETGGAGGNGWLDVNVAGSYLTGVYIGLGAGDSCEDGAEFLTVEGEIPNITVEADSSDVSSNGVFVSGVPFYKQQRSLSCEYAALYIATSAYGNGISEYAFDDVVGWSPNPHWGYRGSITGEWGNTVDYGVYPEALSAALPTFGYTGEVFYSGGDTTSLKAWIDSGVPVVVWLGLWGDLRVIEETDGVPYALTAGMHVVVAYGYDDEGVWVSDPGLGTDRFFSWSDFTSFYSVLDGMSLAVYPA